MQAEISGRRKPRLTFCGGGGGVVLRHFYYRWRMLAVFIGLGPLALAAGRDREACG